MDQLELIIEEGTKNNDKTIIPTVNERLALKVSILSTLSQLDNTFTMNRQLFNWKKRLVDGEITIPDSINQINKGEFSDKFSDWLLDPLLIFCNEPEEIAKKITDKLYEKGYKYVRARNDIYPSRIIIDVEFDIAAILNPINKTLTKHADNLELFGANLNLNGELMLPIFLYEYVTPRFSYEEWKKDIELEPFLWQNMQEKWIKKGVTKPTFPQLKNKEVATKIYNVIKTEPNCLFTGYFTYSMMIGQGEYNGPYHVYHDNPVELIRRLDGELEGMKYREESPVYYFEYEYYQLVYNGEEVLTIYPLKYGMNYVKLGYYNHVNYHGLMLFMMMDALKGSRKEYEERCGYLGYLVKSKNEVREDRRGVYEVLQNEIVGPDTSPFLEFKKKEWNKELTFFYKPEKEEQKEE